jgi:chromosome segregation ATPase
MAAVPQSITLYDHCHDLLDLLWQFDECESDEAREALAVAIREHIGNTREKVDRVGGALASLNATAEAISVEIDRLKERKAMFEKNAATLKQQTLYVMSVTGLKKLEGNTTTLSARNNAESVDVLDAEELPDEFLKYELTKTPIKASIKDALKAGAEVPGARLIQTISLVRR